MSTRTVRVAESGAEFAEFRSEGTKSVAPSRHVPSLDVLRGIAALVVLFGHCTLVYKLPLPARLTFDILFSQRAAVLIFFVLSGYVLTFSWQRMRGRRRALVDFYVRRALRLMPALWVATVVALALVHTFPYPAGRPDFSSWFGLVYRHVGMLREAKAFFAIDNGLIPPTWTITVEIFGSLLVPLLVAVMTRSKGTALALIIVLTGVALIVSEFSSRASMLAFMVQFAAGAGLALFFNPERARPYRLAAAGLIIIFLSRPLFWLLTTGAIQSVEFHTNAAIPALMETVGAVLLVAALASGRIDLAIFRWRPMRAFGDWSYSIYLLHFQIMRVVAYLLPPMGNIAAVISLTVLTFGITVALSAAIYRFVEKPGMALGKRLTA